MSSSDADCCVSGTTPKATPDNQPAKSAPDAPPEVVTSIASSLNTRLRTLHGALPPRTALVIFTGHSDPRRMSALNSRKTAFETAIRSGKNGEDLNPDQKWTAADARELEEAVELARRGLLFLGVKQ